MPTVLAIAGLHAYWSLGGLWPEKSEAELARAVVGDGRSRMPPPWQCFAVAAVLMIVAAWPWAIVVQPDDHLVVVGSIVIAAVFFVRGLAGYSPRWRMRFPPLFLCWESKRVWNVVIIFRPRSAQSFSRCPDRGKPCGRSCNAQIDEAPSVVFRHQASRCAACGACAKRPKGSS